MAEEEEHQEERETVPKDRHADGDNGDAERENGRIDGDSDGRMELAERYI